MNVNGSLIHQQQFPNFPQNFVPVYVPVFVAPEPVAPAAWSLAVHNASAPAPAAPQGEGLSFGTFLAGLTSVVSSIVLLDPKASKGAKEIAKIALGTSLPFVLNQAFAQQAWPIQQWH